MRFFAIRIPEEIANEKRRKARANSKKKGKSPSKITLKLCNWLFLMTNIPQEKEIDAREILALYPIRWSIELFFKQIKSVFEIHKTEVKTNEYRLKCEILGKCIVAMFMTYCYSIARSVKWQLSSQEISIEKTAKYFKRNVAYLFEILLISAHKAHDFVEKMIRNIINTCQKERQKNRNNSLDVLVEQSIYGEFEYQCVETDVAGFVVGPS